MFFASLPDVRYSTTLDFVRHRVGLLRRATLGQPTLPVQRPSVSRFLIAGICGCLLWQPMISKGETALLSEQIRVNCLVSPADGLPDVNQ